MAGGATEHREQSQDAGHGSDTRLLGRGNLGEEGPHGQGDGPDIGGAGTEGEALSDGGLGDVILGEDIAQGKSAPLEEGVKGVLKGDRGGGWRIEWHGASLASLWQGGRGRLHED